jgi:hypothetical protein
MLTLSLPTGVIIFHLNTKGFTMKKLLLSVSTLLLLNVAAFGADEDMTQLRDQAQTQTKTQLKDKTGLGDGEQTRTKLQTKDQTQLGDGSGKMMQNQNQNQNQYQHQDQYKGVPPVGGAKNSYKNGIEEGSGYVGGEGSGTKGPKAKNANPGNEGSSMGGGMKGGGGKH